MSDSTRAAARVPVEERLFSLVLALVATESGLTKDAILSTVQGYRQRFSAGGNNASLERQFERDKDDIRDLGIPLETVTPPEEDGNSQNTRYRIPKGEYDLPGDITFTAEEITLLGLAATVWREGTLSGESQRALMKLRSLGVTEIDPVIGVAPRLRTREAAFEPLRTALERHVVVSFPYVKPGDASARVRTVAPLALVQHSGRWHLYAIDMDIDERRTFLLSRMVQTPRSSGRTFDVPDDAESFAETALRDLDRIWQRNVATVRAEPHTHAWFRLSRLHDAEAIDDDVFRLHFTDINILADEIASFGPEAEAIAPPSLRAAIVQRLTRTWSAHSGAEEKQ
ncbi:helix-turn-helix transcriptional regulator [Paramicrobacterium agarici]|uniref:helix-turn-helix transcriptional regulator n=1 Tax=Paramicrobacterium agarici TaxID=630514 RepID=UPI001151ECAB|nr:WYL domain-containing protein [Microbacterium agarici]TQO21295.1 proteasome accessory factor B [Microbacterium agarici]